MQIQTPEVQQAIHEILTLCLNTPPELADLFFQVHPHVSQVSVDLHPWGWDSRRGDGREDFDLYVDCENPVAALNKMRERIESRLSELKKEDRPSPAQLQRMKLESLEAEAAKLRAELEPAAQ